MAFIPDAPVAKKKSSFIPDQRSLGGFAENIGKSAVSNLSGMAQGIVGMVNPDVDKNTLYGMARVAQGGLQKLDPTEGKVIANTIGDQTPIKWVKMADKARGMSTDYQPQADAVGQMYKDRYGGIENIKKSLYEDPVGVALDASMVLGGAGAGLKGVGALSKSSKLAKAGQIASKVGKVIDPVSIAGKGLGKVGTAVKPRLANVLEGMSEGYATSGLGDPKLLKEIQGVTGKKTSQLMKEYDLFDRSPASAGRAIEGLDTTITSKIKWAPNARVNDILKLFDEKIAQYNIKSGLSTSAKGQLEELLRRRQEFVDYIIKQKKSSLLSNQKKINPLVSEAKKYKSAEEFVKAQGTPVYHGTSLNNANKINTEGFKTGAGKGISGQPSSEFIYATGNKSGADKYVSDRMGIEKPTVVEGGFNGKVLDIQGKMADFEAFGEASKKLGVPLEIDSRGNMTMLNMPAIKKAMQEQGYGAISFSDRYANGTKAYAVLPDQIKTKSQLTDIWNKSNKKKIFRRPSSITPESLREMKQIVGEDVKKFSPDASKSIQTASAQDVYNIYKDKLNELAGTKQLGRDEAGLIKLKDIFKNAEARGQSRQALGLKDFVAGGAGGTIGGVPGALGGIALRQFLDSPKGIQIVTEMLQKGASGVNKMKVPNVFKNLIKGAKYERMINPK